jgi:hypothetical protein
MSDQNLYSVSNRIQTPLADAGPAQTGWDGSVVAIAASGTGDDIGKQGYGQTLELLHFDGGETLAPGGTDTLDLSQVPVGTDSTRHDLIFAQANNLFPVLGSPISDGSPMTLVGGNSAACAKALAFHQNICAFPASKLAEGFATLLADTLRTAGTASEIDDAIDGFFRSQADYADVTFASYVAVTSYLTRFATGFGGFAPEYAYSVYKDGGTGADGSSNAEATLLGTVSFASRAGAGIPSLNDSNGGYDIVYTDLAWTDFSLAFVGGQLVSTTAEESSAIALQCSYTQLSLWTNASADDQRIVPCLYGSIGGVQVLAIPVEQPEGSGLLSRIQAFFKSSGGQLMLVILGSILGTLLLVGFSVWLAKRLMREYNRVEMEKLKELMEGEWAEQWNGIWEQLGKAFPNDQVKDMKFELNNPESIIGWYKSIRSQLENNQESFLKEEQNSQLQILGEMAKRLSEFGTDELMERIKSDLFDCGQTILQYSSDRVESHPKVFFINKAQKTLDQARLQLEQAEKTLGDRLSREQKTALQELGQKVARYRDLADQALNEEKQITLGENGNDNE